MDKWKAKNKDKVKATNKIYWQKWYAENKEKKRLYDQLYRLEHPKAQLNRRLRLEVRLKHKARMAVTNAIMAGKLVRGSCEVIKCDQIAEAHHDDYNKPLVVRWLCKRHHIDHHNI